MDYLKTYPSREPTKTGNISKRQARRDIVEVEI